MIDHLTRSELFRKEQASKRPEVKIAQPKKRDTPKD